VNNTTPLFQTNKSGSTLDQIW